MHFPVSSPILAITGFYFLKINLVKNYNTFRFGLSSLLAYWLFVFIFLHIAYAHP